MTIESNCILAVSNTKQDKYRKLSIDNPEQNPNTPI